MGTIFVVFLFLLPPLSKPALLTVVTGPYTPPCPPTSHILQTSLPEAFFHHILPCSGTFLDSMFRQHGPDFLPDIEVLWDTVLTEAAGPLWAVSASLRV